MPNSCALSCHNASNPWNIVDGDNTKWDESSDVALAQKLDEYVQQWWPSPKFCDLNEDGTVSIADVITLLLTAMDDPTDPSVDWTRDGKYEINDAVAMIKDILEGHCEHASVLLASANGLAPAGKMQGLSKSEIEYIEKMMALMNLTEEEEDAFRLALYGKSGSAGLPKAFALEQNSPNPFNPATTISYSVPERNSAVHVRLDVYDIRGRLVRTLVNEAREAGTYHLLWDGTDSNGRHLASGVYLYRIKAGQFVKTRKMVLLK